MYDFLMAIACILFGYSLIPTVILSYRNKSVGFAWQTVILTTMGMGLTLPVYVGLHLWLSLSTSVITTLCWVSLLTMKIRWRNHA